jgi:GT2 family glycosyltransferase
MQLSVLIPTYNRCETLAKALQALFAQRVAAAWEIIVVDDGSTDGTGDVLKALKAQSPVAMTCLHQENSGPAAARNRGLGASAAPLALMIGDDILAAPDLLSQHLAAHQRHPQPQAAVLGLVDWSPTLTVTPFMRWWGEHRFRFGALQAGRVELDFSFFYTCNVSVKREFLLEHGLFDESFRAAAYEDVELACRLDQAGLQIHFAPQAVAYHHHLIDLQSACRRIQDIGSWSLHFEDKTNWWSAYITWLYLGRLPWLRPCIVRLLYAWAERLQHKLVVAPLYSTLMMYYFWLGRRQTQ